MFALAPDEDSQNIAVGDSGAWQVVASQSGNMLFVRPSEGGVSTNMTVITSARSYAFDLVPANGAPPYEVRFRYPTEPSGDASNMLGEMGDPVGQYRTSGNRARRTGGQHAHCVHNCAITHPDTPHAAAVDIDHC